MQEGGSIISPFGRQTANSSWRNLQALSHVAVNLVDLIDSRRTGKRVKLFPSKSALRNYSIQQRKIFPKDKAKADGFLSALLIEIF